MSNEQKRLTEIIKKDLELGVFTIEEIVRFAKEELYKPFLNNWILETYNK